MKALPTLIWVAVFSVAFAFVESSVVVYLRALYYPDGFAFPLKLMARHHIVVELVREFATIVMLMAVGIVAGKSRWQRFGYFMIAFALWDIFYYVWLKVILGWPESVFDWDILFLVPLPWIGPVLAPILVSILMIVAGVLIVRREAKARAFRAPPTAWTISLVGTAAILTSFMMDIDATVRMQAPSPYHYELLAAGLLCYVGAMYLTFRKEALKGEG
ncbi:MAG TPA: hypothetical protein DCP63_10910 [Bacteroidetes bacterium]|nr:hypothetical protein [Bacteroidota bacterium]